VTRATPAWPAWTAPVALVSGFVAAIFGAIIIGAFAGIDDPPPGAVIAATVVQDLSLVAAAILFARLTRRPRPADFGLRRPRLWPAAGWLLVAWGAFFAFSAAWAAALNLHEKDDLPSDLGADKSTAALIAVAILVTVVAPLAEEFFFRGFFFTALRNWKGLWPAAILTGLVFGGIHVGSAPAAFLVPLAFFGFALCLLYWKTGSLIPCIVLHCLNNSLAFAVTQDWTGGEGLALMVGATCVCLLIALSLARAPAVQPA
jgi:membrane protease YdiL (CAAX protease family)